jgi:methyl-accepting chemotaxis protein
VMQQVVSHMSEIATSSKKISDITGVIDGIAFQTNILALNAAVEAARAGEQGRGFAVVAAEVRTLAQRAAGAAKEIKTLISASVERVEAGAAHVDAAGAAMSEIVQSVQNLGTINARISEASRGQRQAIESVNQAVLVVDNMTQQNAALVEQSAAAAESQVDQAQALNALVGTFKVGEALLSA